jgi:putative sugar O-methyltransferase
VIRDDLASLDTMVADMKRADVLYRPGNYWQNYFDRLVPTLRSEGLSGFRASGHPVFRSMGVTGIPYVLAPDLEPYWFSEMSPTKRRILTLLTRLGVYQRLVGQQVGYHLETLYAFQNAYFQLALQNDPDGALLGISDSCEGRPRDAFHPDGHRDLTYTISFTRYALEYEFAARFIDFGAISSVLELGGGYGGQAEVMLKLHPHLRYVLCDIPPQLYIQQQYLEAVFPGQVTGYLETRNEAQIDLGRTRRITMLGPWQLERLVGGFDLFWNSASFQEMEPDIVENYSRILGPMTRKYVYLKEHPEGMPVARRRGDHGVLEPVTAEHYRSYFSEFDVRASDRTVHVTSRNPHAIPVFMNSFYEQIIFERTSAGS